MIECPYCKKKYMSLITHIFYKHNKTIEQFKIDFPDIKKVHSEKGYKNNLVCEYCGKKYAKNGYLLKHYYKEHHNIINDNLKLKYSEYKDKRKQIGNVKCLICGKKYNFISQHIERTHQINWDVYCKKFNYNGDKIFITDNHRKHLSENKIIFYDSERGLKLRYEQSKLYSGNNNPTCKKKVREKISNSACLNTKNNVNNFNRRGLIIQFLYNNIIYNVRSFEEFKIIYTLLLKNETFKYEKIVIKYRENNIIKSYLLDLEYKNYYIEIKGDLEKRLKYNIEFDCTFSKYKNINTELRKINKELKIMNYDMFCREFGFKKETETFFVIELKKLMQNEIFHIKWYSNKKSRIISKIDRNYKNNSKIIIGGNNEV